MVHFNTFSILVYVGTTFHTLPIMQFVMFFLRHNIFTTSHTNLQLKVADDMLKKHYCIYLGCTLPSHIATTHRVGGTYVVVA
jgi:hypothetical protein